MSGRTVSGLTCRELWYGMDRLTRRRARNYCQTRIHNIDVSDRSSLINKSRLADIEEWRDYLQNLPDW